MKNVLRKLIVPTLPVTGYQMWLLTIAKRTVPLIINRAKNRVKKSWDRRIALYTIRPVRTNTSVISMTTRLEDAKNVRLEDV